MNYKLITGDKVTLSPCTTWSTTYTANPLNTEGVLMSIGCMSYGVIL